VKKASGKLLSRKVKQNKRARRWLKELEVAVCAKEEDSDLIEPSVDSVSTGLVLASGMVESAISNYVLPTGDEHAGAGAGGDLARTGLSAETLDGETWEVWKRTLAEIAIAETGLPPEICQTGFDFETELLGVNLERTQSPKFPGLVTVHYFHEVLATVKEPKFRSMALIGLPLGSGYSTTHVNDQTREHVKRNWRWMPRAHFERRQAERLQKARKEGTLVSTFHFQGDSTPDNDGGLQDGPSFFPNQAEARLIQKSARRRRD
jgi:hypothetical protein